MKLGTFKESADSPDRRTSNMDVTKLSELGRSGTHDDLSKELGGTGKSEISKKKKRKHKSYDRDARLQFKRKMQFTLKKSATFEDKGMSFEFTNHAAKPADGATPPLEHPVMKNAKSNSP